MKITLSCLLLVALLCRINGEYYNAKQRLQRFDSYYRSRVPGQYGSGWYYWLNSDEEPKNGKYFVSSGKSTEKDGDGGFLGDALDFDSDTEDQGISEKDASVEISGSSGKTPAKIQTGPDGIHASGGKGSSGGARGSRMNLNKNAEDHSSEGKGGLRGRTNSGGNGDSGAKSISNGSSGGLPPGERLQSNALEENSDEKTDSGDKDTSNKKSGGHHHHHHHRHHHHHHHPQNLTDGEQAFGGKSGSGEHNGSNKKIEGNTVDDKKSPGVKGDSGGKGDGGGFLHGETLSGFGLNSEKETKGRVSDGNNNSGKEDDSINKGSPGVKGDSEGKGDIGEHLQGGEIPGTGMDEKKETKGHLSGGKNSSGEQSDFDGKDSPGVKDDFGGKGDSGKHLQRGGLPGIGLDSEKQTKVQSSEGKSSTVGKGDFGKKVSTVAKGDSRDKVDSGKHLQGEGLPGIGLDSKKETKGQSSDGKSSSVGKGDFGGRVTPSVTGNSGGKVSPGIKGDSGEHLQSGGLSGIGKDSEKETKGPVGKSNSVGKIDSDGNVSRSVNGDSGEKMSPAAKGDSSDKRDSGKYLQGGRLPGIGLDSEKEMKEHDSRGKHNFQGKGGSREKKNYGVKGDFGGRDGSGGEDGNGGHLHKTQDSSTEAGDDKINEFPDIVREIKCVYNSLEADDNSDSSSETKSHSSGGKDGKAGLLGNGGFLGTGLNLGINVVAERKTYSNDRKKGTGKNKKFRLDLCAKTDDDKDGDAEDGEKRHKSNEVNDSGTKGHDFGRKIISGGKNGSGGKNDKKGLLGGQGFLGTGLNFGFDVTSESNSYKLDQSSGSKHGSGRQHGFRRRHGSSKRKDFSGKYDSQRPASNQRNEPFNRFGKKYTENKVSNGDGRKHSFRFGFSRINSEGSDERGNRHQGFRSTGGHRQHFSNYY